jgi:hypothetical protein
MVVCFNPVDRLDQWRESWVYAASLIRRASLDRVA